MIEENGITYQTGNRTPNTAKKVLRAMVRDGMTKGSIVKGYTFGSLLNKASVLEGTLDITKEYLQVFESLTMINPDVILRNSYGQLVFLYRI